MLCEKQGVLQKVAVVVWLTTSVLAYILVDSEEKPTCIAPWDPDDVSATLYYCCVPRTPTRNVIVYQTVLICNVVNLVLGAVFVLKLRRVLSANAENKQLQVFLHLCSWSWIPS